MSNLCDRQPKACEVGAQAAAAIGQRAQAGAKMVYDLFSEHSIRGDASSVTNGTVRKWPVVAEHAHGSRPRAGLAGPGGAGRNAADAAQGSAPQGLICTGSGSPDFLRPAAIPPYITGIGERSDAVLRTAMERRRTAAGTAMSINEIIENFELLEEWDDRYRYLIELGRALPPLPDTARTDANKVQGCASQVWLATAIKPNGGAGPVLTLRRRQRRAYRARADRHPVCALLRQRRAGHPRSRRDQAVREARPARASDAAALQRLPLDGRSHPPRRQCRAVAPAGGEARTAIRAAGGAAGRAPSASRDASARRHSSAPPSDSRGAGPISPGTAPASCRTAFAGGA